MTRIALFGWVAALALMLGLAACATESGYNVPPTASMVASGQSRISYRAPADGTVYVYDHDSKRLLYSGKVQRGQLIDVNPDANSLTIDGRMVTEQSLTRGNHFEIYVEPAPAAPPSGS